MRLVIIVVSIFLSLLSFAAVPDDKDRTGEVVCLSLVAELPTVNSFLGNSCEVLIPTEDTALRGALRAHFSSAYNPGELPIWNLAFSFDRQQLSEQFTIKFSGSVSVFQSSDGQDLAELVLKIANLENTAFVTAVLSPSVTMKIEISPSPQRARSSSLRSGT